jgi:hypothetical protein
MLEFPAVDALSFVGYNILAVAELEEDLQYYVR